LPECTPLSHYVLAILVNTGPSRQILVRESGLMGRNRVLTISMVVLGAVLFATMAPHSDWGWNENKNVEIPTVNTNWTGNGMADSPLQINIAAPPYIILEAIPNQGQHVDRQSGIRISIQTMSGTYSEYLASITAAPKAQPVILARSHMPYSYGSSPLGITAWE